VAILRLVGPLTHDGHHSNEIFWSLVEHPLESAPMHPQSWLVTEWQTESRLFVRWGEPSQNTLMKARRKAHHSGLRLGGHHEQDQELIFVLQGSTLAKHEHDLELIFEEA